MKILYLNFVSENLIGVRKKISQQIAAFSQLGATVEIGEFRDGYFMLRGKKAIELEAKSRLSRKFCEILLSLRIDKLIGTHNYDLIYVRYIFMTPWLYRVYGILRKKCSKLIIEIPTYPYDNELNRFGITALIDKLLRRQLKKIVDCFTFYGPPVNNIFGVNAIQLCNSIKCDEYALKQKCRITDRLTFIFVGNISFWHGIDRFLLSVANASPETRKSIFANIVGSGKELQKLRKLSKLYNIESNIRFHGLLQDESLDNVFNVSDMGIGALGMHRIGHDNATALKLAEYAARGIPFIMGNDDRRFKAADFVFRVPNSDEPLPLDEIIDWFNRSEFDQHAIRRYVKQNLDWSSQMMKVISVVEK